MKYSFAVLIVFFFLLYDLFLLDELCSWSSSEEEELEESSLNDEGRKTCKDGLQNRCGVLLARCDTSSVCSML